MAQKATTIKEAIKRFEERYKCNATEANEVHLEFQWVFFNLLLSFAFKCDDFELFLASN